MWDNDTAMPFDDSLISYEDQNFSSLDEAIKWLSTILEPCQRFRAQERITRRAFQRVSQDVDGFERLMSYIEHDTAYRTVLETYHTFEKTFYDELLWARRIRRERNRRLESIRCVRATWSHEPQALEWLEFLALRSSKRFSKCFFDSLRTLSRSVRSWEVARQRINSAVQLRLGCRKKGIRFVKDIMTSDLRVATSGKFRGALLPTAPKLDEYWLSRHDMHLNSFGLLAPNSEEDIWPALNPVHAGLAPSHPVGPSEEALEDAPNAGTVSSPSSEIQGGLNILTPSHEPLISQGEEGNLSTSDAYSPQSLPTECFPGEPTVSISDSHTSIPASEPQWKWCSCSADVPDIWISKIPKVSSLPLRDRLDTVQEYLNFKLPCFTHTVRLAYALGLEATRLERPLLRERLRKVVEKRELLEAIERETRVLRFFRREELFAIMYDDED
ncbi:hypothetical protein NUW58_g1140 [Xylaria curta]|uniref:Uncharacterized protein n=1 Tax=Xylaria curta TaxID=42375 RepID=A0ACC1PLL9_9PEZI|nr:hypothetical protein NUW58_g1140 [Xylaria curta]